MKKTRSNLQVSGFVWVEEDSYALLYMILKIIKRIV